MTELFGAFPVSFYDCYKENGLMENGYEERRDLYNLYHILNHLNLFGENYLSASLEVINKYSKIV
jgi:fructosamine-3-kinase